MRELIDSVLFLTTCYNNITNKNTRSFFRGSEVILLDNEKEQRRVRLQADDRRVIGRARRIAEKGSDVELRLNKDGTFKVIEVRRIQRPE